MNLISQLFYLFLIFLTQTKNNFAAPASEMTHAVPELAGLPELLEASIKLSKKNTLEYNQTCSVKVEKRKTELGMKLLDSMADLDFSKLKPIAQEMLEMVNSSEVFCNSMNNLQCGESSGSCECGNGESVGISMKSIRENNECRLAIGSICVPQESLPKVGTQQMNLKCQQNSECILKNSTSPCTAAKMQEALLDGFGGMSNAGKDPKGFMKHTKKMSMAGICTCFSAS